MPDVSLPTLTASCSAVVSIGVAACTVVATVAADVAQATTTASAERFLMMKPPPTHGRPPAAPRAHWSNGGTLIDHGRPVGFACPGHDARLALLRP